MATANERLRDAAVDHAIDLSRYTNGAVSRMIGVLNRTDADLFARIQAAVDGLEGSYSAERAAALLVGVRDLNARAYRELTGAVGDELRGLAEAEAVHQHQLLVDAAGPLIIGAVGVAAISAEQVYAAAMSRPFRGQLLRDWAEHIGAQRMARITEAINIGFVENESISQIVRRLRGTREAGYSDGLLEIDRRNAEAVVRTAVSHMAAFVRDRLYADNADIISAVMWLSTLDSRTTPQCIVRDGKHYTADAHKPIGHTVPWLSGPGALHWNCRSTSVPVLKSWQELGLAMEDLPPETRASMDGQVPGDTTYAQWLARQSAERQDDILGSTRGRMLRSGEITVDRFFDAKGKFLTLDELRGRSPGAFRGAAR